MNNSGFLKRCAAGVTALLTCFSMSAFAVSAAAVPGDVNNDGSVTAADMVRMKNYLLGIGTLTDSERAGADLNGDLGINIIDFVLLKSMFINDGATSENTIQLKGDTVEASGEGITVEGTSVTISRSGAYTISGKMTTDATITVSAAAEDIEDVEITLDNVSMTNTSDTPCIMIENAEKTKITFEGTNVLTNTYDVLEAASAAIYAKDDISFTKKSTGTLKINTNACMAVYCNNDISLNGGTIEIKTDSDGSGIAESDAVKAKGNIELKGADVSINTEGDGIKSTKNAVVINQGTVSIKSGKDALQGETAVTITGGSVTASGDRGITSVGALNISGGTVLATATDNQSSYASSDFTQPVLALDFPEIHTKSEKVILYPTDEAAGALIYVSNKKYSYVLISDPAFAEGNKYQICIDSDHCASDEGTETVYSGSEMFTHIKGLYPLKPPL